MYGKRVFESWRDLVNFLILNLEVVGCRVSFSNRTLLIGAGLMIDCIVVRIVGRK